MNEDKVRELLKKGAKAKVELEKLQKKKKKKFAAKINKAMRGTVMVRKIVRPSQVTLKIKHKEMKPYHSTYFKEEVEELEESLFS